MAGRQSTERPQTQMTLRRITPVAVSGDVQITVPGSDKLGELKVTYAYMTARQHDAWRDKAIDDALSGRRTMTQILGEIITAWDGLEGEDGQPVAYSVAELDDLIDRFPASGGELFRGYTRVLTESRVKN